MSIPNRKLAPIDGVDRLDVWSRLSATLPPGVISWRQDGKPKAKDDRWYARFVAYVDANTVRERLDSVVPGEWDLSLEVLPPTAAADGEHSCSFKAKLQILGVIREDVGTGRDYKSAATDAFKRAAVRFGIAHELYDFDQNWVQVDNDSKYARPVEDPADVYARRQARQARRVKDSGANGSGVKSANTGTGDTRPAKRPEATPETAARQQPAPESAPSVQDEPACPKCGNKMWDNRAENDQRAARGEKLRPDYKCRNRTCDGVIWRPKPDERQPDAIAADGQPEYHNEDFDDDLPF